MNKIEYLNELYKGLKFNKISNTMHIDKPIKIEELNRIRRTLKVLNIKYDNIVIGKPRFRW